MASKFPFTHKLYRWLRWNGAHKFEKTLISHRARFKKDGTIMFYRGWNRLGLGSRPPSIAYFENEADANKIRNSSWKNSFGDVKKFQYYYTLEK